MNEGSLFSLIEPNSQIETARAHISNRPTYNMKLRSTTKDSRKNEAHGTIEMMIEATKIQRGKRRKRANKAGLLDLEINELTKVFFHVITFPSVRFGY